jgi:hypothetical protein
MENTRKELIAFLNSLDSEELRLIADGNISEEQAVDAYLKVSDKGATVKEPLTAEKNSNELFYVCEKIENKVAVWWTGSVYMAEGDPPMWTQNIDNAFRSGSHKEIEGLIALYSLDGYVSEHMYMTLQDNYASSRTVVPSDEEINERVFGYVSIDPSNIASMAASTGFRDGAKWMRKLIEERSSK